LGRIALIVGAVCPLRVDLEQPAGLGVPVAMYPGRAPARYGARAGAWDIGSCRTRSYKQISIALIPTAPPVVYIGGVDHAKAALVKSSGNGWALADALIIDATSVS